MAEKIEKKICGLVMPISAIDGLSEAHWTEVLAVISDAIEKAGFTPNLVSNADDIGIIQKRIIQYLYDNPIVVCDVSGKNPNVMFELGIRLAFDRPTIIVKDDKTTYSFDTAPIEHVSYPRDLRYAKIVEFKDKLVEKIKGTYARATSDPNYTTFLKNFGEFTVAKLDKKEVSGQEFILEELKTMRTSIQRIEARTPQTKTRRIDDVTFGFIDLSQKTKDALEEYLQQTSEVRSFEWRADADVMWLKVTFKTEIGSDFTEILGKNLAEIEMGHKAGSKSEIRQIKLS